VKIGFVFKESDITREANTPSRGVITAVALMLKTVTKKDTLNRLSCQFGGLSRRKENITCATKDTKMSIFRRRAVQDFSRTFPLETSGGLKVDEINSSRNSFSPKMSWHKRRKKKSPCSFKNMTMFTLSHSILSMSTRTGELRQSAF
jgi:hypothetical protein